MRRHRLGLGIAAILLLPVLVLACSVQARLFAIRTVLSVMGAAPAHDENGFTNILLFGVGDEHHDGADLTDTMMLVSIDPVATRSIVLVSLPRDLLLEDEEGYSQGRINALYANEKNRLRRVEKMEEMDASAAALRLVADVMSEKLHMPIHGFVKADFTAFVNTVDAIGGVDITVPERIRDYTYPLTETTVGLFEMEEGPQHLDGETALRYARSRHSSSDFDRSARQQQLLTALATRVRGLGRFEQIGFVQKLLRDVSGHIETSFSRAELMGLAQIASELSLERTIRMQVNAASGGDNSEATAGGFVYPAPPELYEGASVLLTISPTGARGDWSQIRTFTALLLEERAAYLAHSELRIVHAPAARLQAWRLRNELLRYGFVVMPLESSAAIVPQVEPIQLQYGGAEHRPLAQLLSGLLAAPAMHMQESEGGSDILLIVDKNFRFQTFVKLRETDE